jgi:hypothetical protein
MQYYVNQIKNSRLVGILSHAKQFVYRSYAIMVADIVVCKLPSSPLPWADFESLLECISRLELESQYDRGLNLRLIHTGNKLVRHQEILKSGVCRLMKDCFYETFIIF